MLYQVFELQRNFPLKPYYREPVVEINEATLQRLGNKEGTQKALKLLNKKFEDTFNKSFTESLIQFGGANLQVIQLAIKY